MNKERHSYRSRHARQSLVSIIPLYTIASLYIDNTVQPSKTKSG